MKKIIGFISTSRADFGIMLPLIRAIDAHEAFDYRIFVGGMHTSEKFGWSYQLIENNYGLRITEKLVTLIDDDSQTGISQSMGLTTQEFGKIWRKHKTDLDLVFVLGDRFEMFSAVASLLPFNIKIAHLHGGETTLGAIDNKFRHAITAMSDYHFTSNEVHAKRAESITGNTDQIYDVGAMGIDSAMQVELVDAPFFLERFKIDIEQPFILTTYHPETVDLNNDIFINELIEALKIIQIRVLCTLPNADTQGSLIRKAFLDLEKSHPNLIVCHENLGQRGYFTAMKHCTMMIGNTSSGIIEAGAFAKPVINVGNRQKGRFAGENVIHVSNNTQEIVAAFHQNKALDLSNFKNPYGNGGTAQQIMKILEKELF